MENDAYHLLMEIIDDEREEDEDRDQDIQNRESEIAYAVHKNNERFL